ncbi:MAG: flagellar basal body rod protein FlgB [Acidimicrobiales bacterium]
MNDLFTDTTTWALEHALDAVAERQRVASHNIANSATPGFRSKRVDFEKELAGALRNDSRHAAILVRAANTPVGLNNNDVSLEEESAILMRSELLYEALVAAENYKLGLLRTAIGGS